MVKAQIFKNKRKSSEFLKTINCPKKMV